MNDEQSYLIVVGHSFLSRYFNEQKNIQKNGEFQESYSVLPANQMVVASLNFRTRAFYHPLQRSKEVRVFVLLLTLEI